jgi:AcrR family transcriptional regulator
MAELSQSSAEPDTPRARLIAALAQSIEEKGYRDTTVADIVRIARTSRRTFYEHFADRGACFLALFEQVTQRKLELIAQAVDPSAPLEVQIERALDAYIDGISADPELQRSFVFELPGLSEAGAARQRQVTENYAALLVGLVEAARERHPEILRPLSHDVALILVGGLRELLIVGVHHGRDPEELRAGSTEVVKAILLSLKAA